MPLELPPIELAAIAPEALLSTAALLLLVLDGLFGGRTGRGVEAGRPHWYVPVLATIAFGGAIYLARESWMDLDNGPELQLAGMVAVDRFSLFVKITLATFGILSVWVGRDYLKRDDLEESEFYALILFAVAGMMLMASAADLIVVFVALETFSLALYVLVGFRRRSVRSQEAAVKYFLLGSFSSAFFLLGIALTYGATGSTNLYGAPRSGTELGIVEALGSSPSDEVGLLILATGFLIIGLGFKIAAVPFHMWTPDAYEGAPSPVTGFMAASSKLAGFAALLRVIDVVLFPLRDDWRPLVIGIAVVTMIAGSIFAVVQEDVKRLLAYSSIAHAGFLLIGVVAANDRGVSGSLFYLATYGAAVLGAFAVIAVVGDRDERRVRLADYKGLFYERPMYAGALTLFLLSLAGVPLTAGFVGKLVVFGAALEAGYAWLVVIGVLASAIAAFFYLRIMVVMYMQEPDEAHAPARGGPGAAAVVAITAAATLVFGIVWGPLFDLAQRATLFFASP